MSSQPPSELSPLVIAAGGEKLTVQNGQGERVEVFVRLLKMAQLADYMAAADDEQRLAELLLGLPSGSCVDWPPFSVMRVVQLGHDLNFPAACLWAERRVNLTKAVMHNEEILEKVIAKILTGASASSSPSSPASPAKA